MRQLHAVATDLAIERSLKKQDELHWLQVAWAGFGNKRRAVQWVGYYAGNRVAVITWVRSFGKRPAGYMTMVMRRPAGIFKQLAKAQDEVGARLFEEAEAMVALFDAWSKHYDEWRTYSEMLYTEIGQGIWALGQWAATGHEEHIKESAAAIEAAKAQIEAFNARFSVKRRK